MIRLALLALLVGSVAGQVAAQETMTGVYRLTLTPGEVMGPEVAAALQDTVPADEPLEWQLAVPENYDPARPPGVFVFLDPQGWGGIPDEWRILFDEQNLIWVGLRKTTPNPSMGRQLWHAVLGLRAMEQQYTINLNRLYVGSSRDMALLAVNLQLTANEFRGAIYMRGSTMWTDIEPDQLEALRRKRHVFITGTNDKAKTQIRNTVEAYRKAGVSDVKLIFDTRKIGDLPDAAQMLEALRFLDGN